MSVIHVYDADKKTIEAIKTIKAYVNRINRALTEDVDFLENDSFDQLEAVDLLGIFEAIDELEDMTASPLIHEELDWTDDYSIEDLFDEYDADWAENKLYSSRSSIELTEEERQKFELVAPELVTLNDVGGYCLTKEAVKAYKRAILKSYIQ